MFFWFRPKERKGSGEKKLRQPFVIYIQKQFYLCSNRYYDSDNLFTLFSNAEKGICSFKLGSFKLLAKFYFY